MIVGDFLKALGQIGDPAFRWVLFKGIGLTVALLVAVTWAVLAILGWLLPDTLTLPWIGTVGWIDEALSGLSVIAVLVASVFLMIPVASSFTSIFLDEVADAVEARHYPALPRAGRVPLADALRDTVRFLGVLIGANILAFAAYLAFPPAAPVIFLALNGYLLGREYFLVVAMRRLGRAGAYDARRRHNAEIWLAGALMALPLTIPIMNLLVPVLGAATFTHLFQRLEGAAPGR